MEQSPGVLNVKSLTTSEHLTREKPLGNLCSVPRRMRRVQRDVCTHRLPAPGTGLGHGQGQGGTGLEWDPSRSLRVGLHSAARRCLCLPSNSSEGNGSSRL